MTVCRRWALAWLGGAAIGTANGVARELTYRKRVGELRAHQLSSVTAVPMFGAYFAALERRWPIPTRRDALQIGLTWMALTVAFELGVGRKVAKEPWSELLADYDLSRGRVWGLVLAWLTLGPLAIREAVVSRDRLEDRPGSAAPRHM